MISARMSRAAQAVIIVAASTAVALVASACGSEKIKVAKSQGSIYTGAMLFNQRCSGCHTLSYAATHGSAAKVTTAQYNNGPNFDVRCERPVSRVLYAIENGGFSGAIMPQNVVVGQDALDVAYFVAKYAGRRAPKVPGAPVCVAQPIGAIPPPVATTAASAGAAGASSASAAVVASGAKGASGPSGPSGATGAKGAKSKAGTKAKKKKP
jgi:mono/diheme cytochrome c family protein